MAERGLPKNATPTRPPRKRDRWSHLAEKPDWLWRPRRIGPVQVRGVEIHRGRWPRATVWYTHGISDWIGGRTYGELMLYVADEIERTTGRAWRKGPR